MIFDLTLNTIRAGLQGLDVRAQASADAVANMETPGYTANQVDFEAELDRAVRAGEPMSFRASLAPTNDAPLPNGNNVQIEREVVTQQDTALRQELLVEAANSKFRILRTAIGQT